MAREGKGTELTSRSPSHSSPRLHSQSPALPADPHVETSSPESFPGPGSKGNNPKVLPAGSNRPGLWNAQLPKPRGCRALGRACGRGTNPALFPGLQPPARDEITGPTIKPGFLGLGQRGRAGLGAPRGAQAQQPPEPTQTLMNSPHPEWPSAPPARPAAAQPGYFGKEEVKEGQGRGRGGGRR